MNGYLIVIIVYSVAMVGIGFLLTKKVTGAVDFFTAGRSLSGRMLFTTLLAANRQRARPLTPPTRQAGGSATNVP